MLYMQIKEALATKILSGEYLPGLLMPSIRNNSKVYGVHPATIGRSYAVLVAEGLILKQSDNRFYVTTDVTHIATVREKQAYQLTTNFLKNMKEYGQDIRQIFYLLKNSDGR